MGNRNMLKMYIFSENIQVNKNKKLIKIENSQLKKIYVFYFLSTR